MDKELKNKDLEEVSGGGVITDPPDPQPQPTPQPQPGQGSLLPVYDVEWCEWVECCPFSSKSECPAAYIKTNCKYN